MEVTSTQSLVYADKTQVAPSNSVYIIQECFQHTVKGGYRSEDAKLTATSPIVGTDHAKGCLVFV